MDAADRRFYSALLLVSAVAFIIAGYLTLFSIGLGLLFLAVPMAIIGALLWRTPARLVAATLIAVPVLLFWAFLIRNVLSG